MLAIARSRKAIQPATRRAGAILTAAIVLFAQSPLVNATIPNSERIALIALWSSTHGSDWYDSAGWRTGALFGAPGTECGWYGVECDAFGAHVVALNLDTNNLTGTLPEILFSDLPFLRNIDLRGNAGIVGSIPLLGPSSHLETILLQYCNLSGAIPDLSGAPALRSLDLSGNHLSGAVPSLSGLKNLHGLSIDNNALSGTFPSLVGLSELSNVSIAYNNFSGELPSFDGLALLDVFDAEHNQFTGEIPSLASLTNISRLQLAYNDLRGLIPEAPETLDEGTSSLCPNQLSLSGMPDLEEWQYAINDYPWWRACDHLFDGDFEPQGG